MLGHVTSAAARVPTTGDGTGAEAGTVVYGSGRGTGLLTAVILGSAIAFLDSTVVNVALPTIGRELDASFAQLQWVVTGYTLTLAAFILVGGSLGDRLGRRRVYVWGIAGFAITSLLCALAPTADALVAARVLQGVAGALLTPGSLAVIQASFRPEDRGRAIGTWAGVGAIAPALGPPLGGWLAEVDWRLVFLINLPIAALALVLTARFVPESRDASAHGPLDVGGAVLGVLALAGLTVALVGTGGGEGGGVLRAVVPVGWVVAVLAGAGFVWWERRVPGPMVPPSLWGNRTFSIANLLTLVVYAALSALFFFLALQLQTSLGYRPELEGAAALPGGAIRDLRVQPLPWSAAHEKLLTGFAGGSLPDLGQVGNSWLAELTAIGAILPVPAALQGAVAGQFAGVVDTNRIGGRLMALPWYVDTRLQFYRKDLFAAAGFETPPERWDDWKRALHAVKRRQGGEGFAILLPINEYEHLTQMALSADSTFLNADGTRGAFRAPAFREALAFYKSLFDERLAPIAGAAQISNVWNEFARGYFAVYPSGPWTIGDMKSRLPAALQSSWATAPFPGPDGPGRSTPGGSSLVVYASSRQPDRAWALVQRLVAPGAQAKLQELTGDLPPSRSVWARAGLTSDPITDAFARQLDRTAALPKVPEWERIASEMQTVAELFVRGRVTLDEAVSDMDRRADRLLEKRRWMMTQ